MVAVQLPRPQAPVGQDGCGQVDDCVDGQQVVADDVLALQCDHHLEDADDGNADPDHRRRGGEDMHADIVVQPFLLLLLLLSHGGSLSSRSPTFLNLAARFSNTLRRSPDEIRGKSHRLSRITSGLRSARRVDIRD
ncbi:hypothetical protein D9M69_640490 [compost metagenome]